jgi:hypothetical protein
MVVDVAIDERKGARGVDRLIDETVIGWVRCLCVVLVVVVVVGCGWKDGVTNDNQKRRKRCVSVRMYNQASVCLRWCQ